MTSLLTNQLDSRVPSPQTGGMALTTSLQSMTPPEVDALLFPLLAERYEVAERRAGFRNIVAKTVWTAQYVETFEKYLDRWSSKRTHAVANQYGWEKTLNNYNERINACTAHLAEIEARIAPYEAEYKRRPWNRFLLVQAGHIHIPGKCGTIRPTTRAGWIIDASGFEADEVVRKYDYTACTKCFPDAPVSEPTADPSICTAGPYEHTGKAPHARYRSCAKCGYFGAITGTGKLRKHKKPVAK